MKRSTASLIAAITLLAGCGETHRLQAPLAPARPYRPSFDLVSTIAFSSTRDDPTNPNPNLAAEIYLMAADGTNLRRLTDNAFGDGFAALSPDGKKIAFNSNRRVVAGEPANTADVFVMDSDGEAQTFVTRGSSPTWSPDSREIAFHASASGTGLPIKPDPGAATFDSDLVHALQHLCFFFAGVAFWMSLVGPLPKPSWFTGAASAGFVFAVRLIGAVLANVLMWSSSVIYARYAPGEAAHNISALSDQGMAGVVMMAESTVITLSILTWLVLRWASRDTERQELLDLAAARGVELDPARAERAVSAGQGERLRERIESTAAHSEASGPA